MKNNVLLKVGTSAAVLGLLTNQACKEKEDEIAPVDLIIGDWKLVEVNGDQYVEESDDYVYFLSMEFMTDGGIQMCYHYEYPLNPSENNKSCYQYAHTNWEWVSTEDAIIKFTSDDEISTAKVDFPTDDLMNWSTIEESHDFDSIKFERID